MDSSADAEYRLRLAEGFLAEAEEDVDLSRWRSCVDNAQLAVENAANSVIARFGPVPRSHDLLAILSEYLERGAVPPPLRARVERLRELSGRLGFEEHVRSDYGDEARGITPWELFRETDARAALRSPAPPLRRPYRSANRRVDSVSSARLGSNVMADRVIRITAGDLGAEARLNESKTAIAIWDALPIHARAQTWGDEIYFDIGIDAAPESPREVVELGDLGYWPPGQAFCIFFGPTPMSRGPEIRPASAVNIVGRLTGAPKVFKAVRPGAAITIERA